MNRMKTLYIIGVAITVILSETKAQTYELIERRNPWNAGSNVTGILTDSTSISYAEAYGKNGHGDFRNYYEADKTWSAGALAKSVTHLKRYSLTGSFSFDHTSGNNMSGSMFIRPGFYPVDILEFTPGRKDLQSYSFMGGIAADIDSRWRVGGKIDFTSANYSKRKDVRHTNYRLELSVAPSVMYHSGDWSIGFSYLFNKNSESVSAEVIGSTEASYYAFLDKGLMHGAYETWDGSGIHLNESGVSGFPVKELSHGGALQLQWKAFYGDIEYLRSSGSAGEKETIWFKFPADRIQSHLSYRFTKGGNEHFLRFHLSWLHQTNNEQVLGNETENGITTTYIYGSNRIFERDILSVRPEYEFVSPRQEIRTGIEMVFFKRQATQMYPYIFSEKMHQGKAYVSGTFHLGAFDLKAGGSFSFGDFTEEDRMIDTDMEAGAPPYRLTEYYLLQNEYATASQINIHLGIRYNFRNGIYTELAAEYTHGFHLKYITGADRWNENIKVGYYF